MQRYNLFFRECKSSSSRLRIIRKKLVVFLHILPPHRPFSVSRGWLPAGLRGIYQEKSYDEKIPYIPGEMAQVPAPALRRTTPSHLLPEESRDGEEDNICQHRAFEILCRADCRRTFRGELHCPRELQPGELQTHDETAGGTERMRRIPQGGAAGL